MKSERESARAICAPDIRSALSTIHMNVEFALAELAQSPRSARARAALVDCKNASDKLRRIMEMLIDLSRAQHDRLSLRINVTNAHELLRRVVEQSRADADARGVRVALSGATMSAVIDAQRCERALLAMIEAALRASRRGDTVRINADCDADKVVVRLSLETSTSAVIASGLAWQYVRTIAEAHHGSTESSVRKISIILPRGLSRSPGSGHY